jgi:hypothetical protein
LLNPVAPVEFFVSPRGKDSWSGRVAEPSADDGPFATIGRAKQAVREFRKTQTVPVRVTLRGGTYFLDKPLEFWPADSGTERAPITYAAAAREKVVLSGGRRLTGGQWGEVNGQKAWMIDLPEVKINKWKFRQLFVNGERRPRTRLPKMGMYRIESLPGYDWKRRTETVFDGTKQFVYSGTDVQRWRNLQDVGLFCRARHHARHSGGAGAGRHEPEIPDHQRASRVDPLR